MLKPAVDYTTTFFFFFKSDLSYFTQFILLLDIFISLGYDSVNSNNLETGRGSQK